MLKQFFIASVFFFTIMPSSANDAFLGSRGGNVFPIIHNESIRMEKEVIHVLMGKDSCSVTCKFWFKNTGTKHENVFMGFPDYINLIAQNTNPLRGFTCSVNGVQTRWYKQTQITTFDSLAVNYENWFCWDVQFEPGETILVENTYHGDLGGSVDGTVSFSYLIGTAQTWSSTIANGKVVFDYSQIASKVFIDTTFYSDATLPLGLNRTIYNDSTVFSYNNYLPKWNETLHVRLVDYWSVPYGEFVDEVNKYQYNPTCFKTKDQSTLRLIRNEVFARHGYVFKDAELMDYFQHQSWYKPNAGFDPNSLSKFERMFVNYIKDLESSNTSHAPRD